MLRFSSGEKFIMIYGERNNDDNKDKSKGWGMEKKKRRKSCLYDLVTSAQLAKGLLCDFVDLR